MEPEPLLLTTREAARLLGIGKSTLERIRYDRRPGPPYLKVGGAVRYPAGGLREWAQAQAQRAAR